MIRVAIVEDDAEVQGVLQEYVRRYTRQYGTEFEVTVFADGVDILEDYRAVYDIIFLDVEMKHLDGMTTAERIRQMDADVILIFITNMAQYAIRGYSVGALDYVLKPVPYFAFSQQLLKAVARLEKRAKRYLTVPVEGGLRAALPQTIGALRAGSVRGPCTELVPQLIGRVCGVAVFAAAASKDGIAVCFTGGIYGNSLIVVSQDGQLRVGGIVTTGAGFVSVPALFRTGGRFCCVLLQIMVQCGQLHIGGGIVTTGAGIVSIPANSRTGGGFCCVMPQIMLCRQLRIGGIVAAGAGFVSIPAGFRTGRSFCCVLLQSMVQRGYLFAGGIIAAGAGVVSIPALFRAGGGFCFVVL